MRNLPLAFFFAFNFFLASNAYSASSNEGQDDDTPMSLVDSAITSNGGYGGFSTRLTHIDGQVVDMGSIQGGWIINHHWILGLAGYGVAGNGINAREDPAKRHLDFSYGGVLGEYVIAPASLVHGKASLLVASGQATLGKDNGRVQSNSEIVKQHYKVLEPSLEADVSVTHWLQIGLGASYRYVNGEQLGNIDSNRFNGYSANLIFNFGSF